MLGFVVRRLAISIPVLLLASFLVFTMVANSGDPLAQLKNRNPAPPPEVIAQRERQLNLDKPVINRYWLWISDFVRGDFGEDLRGREVRPDLWHRLIVTLRMVLLAVFLAIVLAVVVGVIGAVRQYSALDYTFTFTGFLFLSMPVFWLGALLKEFLAIRLNDFFGSQIVYTVGEETPNLTGSFLDRLGNQAGHLVLPTITLALITYAAWSRYQRSAMLDVLSSDYVRLAHAKGLSRRRVLVRHALRNALIPITTVVAIDFGAVLGGAILTERVFTWQGMGSYLVAGIQNQDVYVVSAWLMVSALIVILFNLIADILYGVLDPRIRVG